MAQEEIKINCRGTFVKNDQVVLPRELKMEHLKKINFTEEKVAMSHYWPIFKKFYAKIVETLGVKP